MKNAIKFVALVSVLLSIQKMNADTNDTYTVQDMFQTVVTPTEFSTTQSQHDQLPDIHTMPKLDKEAIYLYYKESETEFHRMNLKVRALLKDYCLKPGWGQYTYYRYNDGSLGFDIYAHPADGSSKKSRMFFLQKKDGKFYQQSTPLTGERAEKKWTVEPSRGVGEVYDYKNNMKHSGCLFGTIDNKKNTLEYTESSEKQGKKLEYNYKAEFTKSKTPCGEELKFKATHISIVDGKADKPIVTETVYKGTLLSLLHEVGLYMGYPRPMKTFKTIRD